jgi:hypothetical protein
MSETTNDVREAPPTAIGEAADSEREAGCCGPVVQAACCEPKAKASCCGPEPATTCGCQ